MLLLPLTLVFPLQAENWPRYRGADGSGVSLEKGFPASWSQGDYEWVAELPGEGHSSPVIWDRDLFVTTATDEGRLRYLMCLDAVTGAIKWSRVSGFNTNPKHNKNSFASSTPATDGERVYVAFADEERFGLAAYDFDGNLVWRNWLGPFLSRHGQGTSPIVFEDLVIIPNDQDGPSSIVAYDRRNGRLVWSTLRAAREASYATPLILESKGRKPQLICLSGATGLSSLDPWSGALNWSTAELPARTVASPTYASGLVYAICGQGGKGVRLIGVDPTGAGAVETTHVKFRREKDIPYVPAAIGVEDSVFLWTDNGVVICLDPKTQKTRWQERVGGNFSGSPICVDGKLYCIEESGKVIVVAAGTEFRQLGENPIGDPSYSTPAVANGRMYLRSYHRLSSLRAKSID
jgi:outer membrane protein assembly factor BamB